MENHASAIDKLFDENNNDNIVLYNEKGVPTEFEQVALIPLEGKPYAILCLANPNEDIGEDEGIVFSIEMPENGKKSLQIVTDDEIIGKVFDKDCFPCKRAIYPVRGIAWVLHRKR